MMTSYEAAILSCRMLALYVFYQAMSVIGMLPSLVQLTMAERGHTSPIDYYSDHMNFSILLTYLVPFPLFIAFAAFLWFSAPWFASRIMTVSKARVEASSMRLRGVQAVILAIIGIFILTQVIPEAAKAIVNAVLLTVSPEQVSEGVKPGVTSEYWALIVRFSLGLGLIFGAARISDTLDKVRGVETSITE